MLEVRTTGNLEVHDKKRNEGFHREEKIPKIKRWKFGLLEIWKMKNAMKGDKKPPIRLCKQEDRENQKKNRTVFFLLISAGEGASRYTFSAD